MEDAKEHVVRNLRALVQDMMAKHMYEGAIFYANKLALMTGFNPKDVFLLANALFVDNQYHRCLHLLESRRDLVDLDMRFRLLAARCLIEAKSWEECVAILEGQEAGSAAELPFKSPETAITDNKLNMMSCVCSLLGQAYENLENFEKAVVWYKEAVLCDPFNSEAFTRLVHGNKLTEFEEEEFLNEVIGRIPSEASWLKLLYTSLCRGNEKSQEHRVRRALEVLAGHTESPNSNTPIGGLDTRMGGGSTRGKKGSGNRPTTRSSTRSRRTSRFSPMEESTPSPGDSPMNDNGSLIKWNIGSDSDVVASRAKLLMKEGRYSDAHRITKAVLDRDSFDNNILPVYLAVAVKLRKKNEIFLLGHKLMEQNPESAEAWYAAGCYYYATYQFPSARQYFGKATTINKMFAPGWIAFAHSFAAMDETDHAMAAYRTAARLFPGLHEPLVGMSLEYAKMNNMPLAEEMMRLAYAKCPHDPSLLHEMGTLAYKDGKYDEACKLLERVVEILEQQVTVSNAEAEDIREVSLVNLGHTYRKLQRWEDSLDVLHKALSLEPYQPGTHAAIAYTYHLMKIQDQAIEYYHKALSLNPADPFSTLMLNIALTEANPAMLDTLEEIQGDDPMMTS